MTDQPKFLRKIGGFTQHHFFGGYGSSLVRSKKSGAGFTLLELLVVVAIIAFLASISIIALSASQRANRDTKRALDQQTIIKAAELYTNDFGVPPAQLCDGSAAGCTVSFNNTIKQPLVKRQSSLLDSLFGLQPALAQTQIDDGGDDGGGGGPVCGNGSCESGETSADCPADCGPVCGNGVCESGESTSSCVQDCPVCNSNAICEPSRGENISNCANDCYSGGGGGAPVTCGNGQCDAGETPGNCGQDCADINMCKVGGEWSLCCLFGGTYCGGEPAATAGYYGVCNVNKCEQKYLLGKPTVTCQKDADCTPSVSQDSKFVSETSPNWLRGLERYVVAIPKDPGGHQDPALNKYYCSSNPDIVGRHRFCCWISFERVANNFNPYDDLRDMPTGASSIDPATGKPLWTPLCIQ